MFTGQSSREYVILLIEKNPKNQLPKTPFCTSVLVNDFRALGLAKCFVGELIRKTLIYKTCR